MITWRDLGPADLEAQMNPRATIGATAVEAHLESYARRSAEARRRLDGTFDIRYGPGPKATFDLFRPAGPPPHPILVFLHGGYWRTLDKAEHHFVATGPVAAGYAALIANYDLCPAVDLDHIVRQARELIRFIGREASALQLRPERIALAGHSAGAHLAALIMHDAEAGAGVGWAGLVSGIYEPAVVLGISVNAEVRMTTELAARNDALVRMPKGKPVIDVTVGAKEPPAWIAQSTAYADAARAAGIDVTFERVASADHFAVIDHPLVPRFAT